MDDQERSGPRGPGPTARKVIAFVLLVAVAGLALPLSAMAVEAISDRAENWIMVVQFLVVLVVAIAFTMRPAVDRSRGRSLAIGILAAVAATLIANAVWLFGMAG